jgi:S-DNA-T family DNA segregation ATPase FtsK/SpoIIIE
MERRTADAPPSLVIVIDEFATLAKEVPEFVEGVVDVAQRGRSLGVHLVLATQRPGGVVSENIRANVNLRIALRMAAPTESADVVGVVDAARISRTTPGRALARVGQGDLQAFQAAYVGGITTAAGTGPAIELREFGFGTPAGAEAQPSRPSTAFGTVSTDLEELVKAVNVANEREQHPPQPSPWLPALAPIVPLASLPPSADPVVTYGLIDEPARQRQVPLTHDFEQDGSMLVYGASGAGKTALLRTIAVSLAAQTPPDRLHLYGLDFATRGLTSLEALPHCGGVVLGEDEERVARLLHTIGKTLAVRRERFAARGAFTLSEYNRAVEEHEVLPRIVILFDGYAGFFSTFERINLGELVDALPRLVADSRPLGVHFVITAERRATISGQLSGIVPTKVVLRMADADEYGSLGLDARVTKDVKLPAGRGFVRGSTEAQCALVGDDPSGEGQLAAISRAARAVRERFGDGHVPPIAPLPTSVPRDDLPPASPLRPILGLGDDDLDSLTVDLTEAHFVVAGPYRSGRSTALETIARSLLDADPGIAVHLLAPRRSPLPTADVGWTSVSRGVEACDAKAGELVALAADLDEGDPPLVIVIDDGDELAETLGASALETLVRRGRDAPIRIVAASETQAMLRAYGGWLRELRKDEHGLLLDPDLDVDGDLFGVRLPRRTNAVFPAGRGYYVWRGTLELVQVAA